MGGRKRLGVIGSIVWDRIYGRGRSDVAVEEWGGITYSLNALEAGLSDDWQIVPLIKVGSDLAPQARDFIARLRKMAPDGAPIEVPQPNNRVTIYHEDTERRCEVLSGGVPPWSWVGLKPLLADLDALYINLISGFELDLETAQLIRAHYRGPIYCDLHSLLLAVQPGGMRTLQPLPNPQAWLRCFDFIQVNEDEMRMMATDPMSLAAMAMAEGVSCLNVTLGRRGVVYFAAPGIDRLADIPRGSFASQPGAIRTALVTAARARDAYGDTTGCGDVWGATYFARLLAGETIDAAMRAAMIAAARNVEHRGPNGLSQHLRGLLSAK